QERRTYPITAELGLTDRLSVSLIVPIVRVATRASLQLSNRGANLGVNPLVLNTPGARGTDSLFFAQFDTALVRLDQQVAQCTPAPAPCAARDSSARWRAVRDALHGSVYGLGQTGSPFLPLDTSTAGKAIDSTVAPIHRGLTVTFGVGRGSPAGPRRAADAGAVGGAALAQCGRPRRDAASGDAGAPRRALGRISGPGCGHGGPALGSRGLRRRGRSAAGAPRAGVRGR